MIGRLVLLVGFVALASGLAVSKSSHNLANQLKQYTKVIQGNHEIHRADKTEQVAEANGLLRDMEEVTHLHGKRKNDLEKAMHIRTNLIRTFLEENMDVQPDTLSVMLRDAMKSMRSRDLEQQLSKSADPEVRLVLGQMTYLIDLRRSRTRFPRPVTWLHMHLL
jgi:hypothetical protein